MKPVLALLLLITVFPTYAPAADKRPAPVRLEDELQQVPLPQLAAEARRHGSATRGAIIFHQPVLACTKCHSVGEDHSPLGPDLAVWKEKPKDTHIVESILYPAKQVRKGFEAVTVVDSNGKTYTGLIQTDGRNELVLKDPSRNGKLIRIPNKSIELRKPAGSIMPTGLVNQLANRQQFLDLVKYLIEVSERGPRRAKELRPPAALFALPPVPEYERKVDHAGLIAAWDRKSFERGKAIYNVLCINCHGTKNRPGSLPTSLRFAGGKFKNGSDPYAMYQTLTYGFGMMIPQAWMVPQQKYDVIHYIREAYLKPYNPGQYAAIPADYLKRLPKGNTRGPAPRPYSPWANMNYGPTLIGTYEAGSDGTNIAGKGIAVRLDGGPGGVSRGRDWMVFDHDTLRVAAAWSGKQFIDYNGIMFNGRHNIHPRITGDVHWANPTGPGWANPETGTFADPRLRGRDGKPYGPLPRDWAHYKGLYHYGNNAIISYSVGTTGVLEMPGMQPVGNATLCTRAFNIGPRNKPMVLQVARDLSHAAKRLAVDDSVATFGPAGNARRNEVIVAGVMGELPGIRWESTKAGDLRLRIPMGKTPLRFTLAVARADSSSAAKTIAAEIHKPRNTIELSALTKGGPPRWGHKLATKSTVMNNGGPFEVDVLTRPAANPWSARVRFTGLDFLPDGKRMAICSWDGDVWMVSGIDDPSKGLSWQRIASGLFQPLGLKYVDGRIYLTCRDQLCILHDLNGDGETDFYQNFNNDHQVTEHFHEFAMGLQTDAEGNFYYAKSARHALPAIVPHHGTLLKITKDGRKTEILATGFRAANGVCLNPDGTFYVTDQEGHWNPKNRINLVRKGGFYGNMLGYHNVKSSADDAMEQPLCWITNSFDRSPAELLWVDKSAKWGPLNGSLLNLSYGYGKVFVVLRQKVGKLMQGGMCELPLPSFPTGLIRGRFNPRDGQLYTCGMFAWAGSKQQPGGAYRIRYTGKPVHVPLEMQAKKGGIELKFSGKLDATAGKAGNYAVKVWSLKRTKNYGSKHYDEHPLKVTAARLREDGKTIDLTIPDLKPTWCIEIRYSVRNSDGEPVQGMIHGTIHQANSQPR